MTDENGNRKGFAQIHGDGPAFPVDLGDMTTIGMSLRDWFAGQALGGILTRGGGPKVASEAYAVADAMIKARKK